MLMRSSSVKIATQTNSITSNARIASLSACSSGSVSRIIVSVAIRIARLTVIANHPSGFSTCLRNLYRSPPQKVVFSVSEADDVHRAEIRSSAALRGGAVVGTTLSESEREPDHDGRRSQLMAFWAGAGAGAGGLGADGPGADGPGSDGPASAIGGGGAERSIAPVRPTIAGQEIKPKLLLRPST